MQRLMFIALPVAVAASLAIAGSAPAANTVVPVQFVASGWVDRITVVDPTGPRVRDTVVLHGIGSPLVQFTIVFHRVYDPETKRGTVSGTIGATGPESHRGGLRGVMTPEGMSGTFSMTRTSIDHPFTYRILGTWNSDGHPATPTPELQMPAYPVFFEGRVIGPFE